MSTIVEPFTYPERVLIERMVVWFISEHEPRSTPALTALRTSLGEPTSERSSVIPGSIDLKQVLIDRFYASQNRVSIRQDEYIEQAVERIFVRTSVRHWNAKFRSKAIDLSDEKIALMLPIPFSDGSFFSDGSGFTNGPKDEAEARWLTARRAEQVHASIALYIPALAGIGHNHPPEPIELGLQRIDWRSISEAVAEAALHSRSPVLRRTEIENLAQLLIQKSKEIDRLVGSYANDPNLASAKMLDGFLKHGGVCLMVGLGFLAASLIELARFSLQ